MNQYQEGFGSRPSKIVKVQDMVNQFYPNFIQMPNKRILLDNIRSISLMWWNWMQVF